MDIPQLYCAQRERGRASKNGINRQEGSQSEHYPGFFLLEQSIPDDLNWGTVAVN